MIVDAHLHLWDVEKVPLSWFSPDHGLPGRADLGALRSEVPGEQLPEAAVVVQAADSAAELAWLLDTAEQEPFVRAVVAQHEPRPAAWAGIAQPHLEHPALAGIRLAVRDRAPDLGDVDGVDALADGLAGAGLVLEMLIGTEHLPAVATIASRHPELAIVICHLGLGGEQPHDAWRDGLRELAVHPRVFAKASGLHRPGADAERVRVVVRDAVELLGADRLMFGSDWPVSTRTCGYRETVARTRAALPPLTDAESAWFWGGLARRLYLS